MKKVVAFIMCMVSVISLVPLNALAAETESYEQIKQHVSSIYGIPLEIVDMLDEDKVRGMDVEDSQVVSTSEEYIEFVTNADGNITMIPATEEDYLKYIAQPAPLDERDSASNSWMRVFLSVIDNGSTYQLSTNYTWLTTTQATFTQKDMLSLCWENGTYVQGSAEGFHTYKLNTPVPQNFYEDLEGFEQPSGNPKTVNHVHEMSDSLVIQDEFFHMSLAIRKNTGAGAEHTWSYYSRQRKGIDLAGFLAGGTGLGSVFFIESAVAGTLTAVGSLAVLAGSINTYYDTFGVDVAWDY